MNTTETNNNPSRGEEHFSLSVVMPVFNEAATVRDVIDRVCAVEDVTELIVVDDGSTDGTRDILLEIEGISKIRIILQPKNSGKGNALRAGFAVVTGDVVVIQDADLEYDPEEFSRLLALIANDEVDAVYGSRFMNNAVPGSSWLHRTGNRIITAFANLRTGLGLTDVETCYKMFRTKTLRRVLDNLQEDGFGFEIEVTARLARLGDVRFREVPIPYHPRSNAEGKKIGWRDAVRAFWCIARY